MDGEKDDACEDAINNNNNYSCGDWCLNLLIIYYFHSSAPAYYSVNAECEPVW